MEVDRAGPRRLLALIDGLPPESATSRVVSLPPFEEVQASLLERFDEWSRLQILHASGKSVELPGRIRVLRPGETEEQERQPKVADIMAWFARAG